MQTKPIRNLLVIEPLNWINHFRVAELSPISAVSDAVAANMGHRGSGYDHARLPDRDGDPARRSAQGRRARRQRPGAGASARHAPQSRYSVRRLRGAGS